jgi:hypothetical protein
MKVLAEILLSIFLHPIAVVLGIIHVAGRTDLNFAQKVLWAIAIFFLWGLGPIVYILFGKGALW